MNSLLAKFSISLGTMTLLTPLSWGGQTTLERVKAATTELEKLTENEMRETGIPGIAIAVVFNDQAIFAKGFGARSRYERKSSNRCGHSVSTGIRIEADRLDGGRRSGR